MRGGEFIEKELQTAVDKDELTYAALKEAMEYGHNRRKWLIFASGTDHADHICDMLNTMGIQTGCVHSKREGRDETIRAFKRGDLRAVVNNNVLTTGFDDPEIDMIVCLRPTASAVLWVQMLGRGTRPLYYVPGMGHNGGPQFDLNDLGGRLAAIETSGKHNCLVLDYAGNAKRLGPINDPVTPRRKGQGKGEAPIKLCPKCENEVHASLRFCNAVDLMTGKKCDHEFVFESKLMQSASSTELVKGDTPIVEVFKVDHITVTRHEKIGAPPMMRVNYYCNLRSFSDYVCVEHTNFAARKARQWWSKRSDLPMPTEVEAAIEAAGHIKHPTHLRVWINKKYPEILAECWDGTAFGTQEANPADTPFIQTDSPKGGLGQARTSMDDLDDEIPF
jgi:DNA repair protein RadD